MLAAAAVLPRGTTPGTPAVLPRGTTPGPPAVLPGGRPPDPPKRRSPVASITAHSFATSSCLTAASARTVFATWAGVLDLPRFGAGVRNGLSVSASMSSAGRQAAASLSAAAFPNVTVPAKLST